MSTLPAPRRRTTRIAVGCAIAVAIGAEVAVLTDTGGSPADAVRTYFQAALDKDCPTAFAQLTDPIRSTFGSVGQLCDRARGDKLVSFEVGDESIADGTATVTVTLVRPNLELTDQVLLTTVDGQWRISSFEVVRSDHGHART
jgi:hypothetical protein